MLIDPLTRVDLNRRLPFGLQALLPFLGESPGNDCVCYNFPYVLKIDTQYT
jgi:hypothetical protein